MAWEFRLRFPASDISQWADCYTYLDDADVERIGQLAGARGKYTRAELLKVARWKTRGRSEWLCELNTEAQVRAATTRALRTRDERERVDALIGLHGVALPTASVLLHLARPNLYPIIDFRALWSLGVEKEPRFYGFALWWAYVEACRALSTEAGVTMRRLDRALWQYSKEHQKRAGPGGGEAPRRRGDVSTKRPVSRDSAARDRGAVLEAAMGPVERAIRKTFSPPVSLRTLAQGSGFELETLDDRGIRLLRGERRPTRLSWECLEGVPAYLRQHPGWIPAGGSHVGAGAPGTLDEHLKRYLSTHVSNYITRILLDAGIVEARVDSGSRQVLLRLRE